jgi:hypothetical protein
VGVFIRLSKPKYWKIISAKIHAKSNDDVDNKTSDEVTEKTGNGMRQATIHT